VLSLREEKIVICIIFWVLWFRRETPAEKDGVRMVFVPCGSWGHKTNCMTYNSTNVF